MIRRLKLASTDGCAILFVRFTKDLEVAVGLTVVPFVREGVDLI